MKDRIPIAQWPELFDAALRRSALFNRMVADIAYSNLRFGFELARAKTLGDVVKLQAEYWQNLFTVLQGKEFREAFFPFGVPHAETAPAGSPKPESAKPESAKAESARPFAQPSIAPDPVMAQVIAREEPKIAASPVAGSPAVPPPVKMAKQASEQKRAAATRAAQSKTKGEKPQSRPQPHRAETRGARKQPAAQRRQAPQQAAAPGGRSEIRFARLDDNAVRFTGKEAWRLRNGTWRKIPLAKVADEAVVLSKARFDQLFTKVPKLPAGAFKRERD